MRYFPVRVGLTIVVAGILSFALLADSDGQEKLGKFHYVVETDGVQLVDMDGDGNADTVLILRVVVDEGVARGFAHFLNADYEAVAIFDSGVVEPAGTSAVLEGILYRTMREPVRTVDSHPQEVLDLVAAATADLSGGLSFILLLSNGETAEFEAAATIKPLHDRILVR